MPEPHSNPETIVDSDTFSRNLAELTRMRRQLPSDAPGHIRRRVSLAIQVAASPTCPESQGDGVPCSSAHSSCDHCIKALEFIETVRAEVEMALREEPGPRADPDEI